jgi:hypothetical protein
MKPIGDEAAASVEWIVVCVACRRIKRKGEWTNDIAVDTAGHSTGYCEECANRERKTRGR